MRRWSGMWVALVLLSSSITPLHADPLGAEETLFSEMPVVVTATKKEESALTAPGTIYVFTDKDIERWGWMDLKDILAAVPNMDLKNDYNWLQGGQRGFTGTFNATLLLVDGREMQNLLADEAFINGSYPASRIRRVEILQGPNSTLYGASAMQGIINIITKTGDGQPDAREVSVLAGDANTQQASAVMRKDSTDGGPSFGFSASSFRSDRDWRKLRKFTADDKRYSRSPRDQYRSHADSDFYNREKDSQMDVHLRYKSLYAGANRTEGENLNGLENVEYDYRFAPTRRESTLTYAGVDKAFGDALRTKLEYRHTKDNLTLNLYGPFPDPVNSPTPGVNDYDDVRAMPHLMAALAVPLDRDQWYGQADLKLNDWVNAIAGFDYRMYYLRPGYRAINELRAIPEHDAPIGATDQTKQRERSFFLENTVSLASGRVTFTGGVMYHEKDYVDPSWLPRAAVGVMLGEGSVLKATYGKGFRAPDGFERLQGQSAGFNRLPPPEMEMWELNLSHIRRIGAARVSNVLAAYNMQASNIFVPFPGVSNGGNFEGKFKVNGVEDMVRVGVGHLESFASARYIRPDKTQAAGDAAVLNVPSTKFKLGLSYDATSMVTASVFTDYWSRVKSVANRADLSGTEIMSIPAWWSANGNVLLKLSEQMEVSFHVENIFDKTYYHANTRATSPIQFMQPPRSFRATVKMKV